MLVTAADSAVHRAFLPVRPRRGLGPRIRESICSPPNHGLVEDARCEIARRCFPTPVGYRCSETRSWCAPTGVG